MKYRFLKDGEPVVVATDEQRFGINGNGPWKPLSVNIFWRNGEIYKSGVHCKIRRPITQGKRQTQATNKRSTASKARPKLAKRQLRAA